MAVTRVGLAGLGLFAVVAMCTAAAPGARTNGGTIAGDPLAVSWTQPSVTTLSAPRQPQEWLYIHGTMNVRAEPRRDARVVRTLQRGDRVQLGPADANGWARVHGPGSPGGYLYRASDNVRAGAPAAQLYGGSGASGSGRSRSSVGRTYYRGPRGGCYYYSSSGRKQYVERSRCS